MNQYQYMHSYKILVFTLTLFISTLGTINTCRAQGERDIKYTTIQEVPQAQWDGLRKKNIFFGHHSVGQNILSGIDNILKKTHK